MRDDEESKVPSHPEELGHAGGNILMHTAQQMHQTAGYHGIRPMRKPFL